ncbi:MAG TPA: pentapeptide repeat-containing protein [Longilinea sp.]|nr:pentapeptide repeat-containing protein [Longilinea sp.]
MHAFTETYYENETFKGLTCEKEIVTAVLYEACRFERCSFQETQFKKCKFRDCTFSHCDLNLAQVEDSAFSQVQFDECKLVGINWAKAAWGKFDALLKLKAVDFKGCVLNYSVFMGMNLNHILLQHCIAKEVDFSEALLRQADCTGTDFTGSRFNHTDLTEADLRRASNYHIPPQLNTLKKTRFSLPEAMALLYALDIQIDPDNGDNA